MSCIFIKIINYFTNNYTYNRNLNCKVMGTVFSFHQNTVYNQIGGTCYAHAIAEAIISTELRIIGRIPEKHTKIVRRLVAKYGYKGAYTYDVLRQQCLKKSFGCKYVTEYQAQVAVSKGRTVVVIFSKPLAGWKQFSQTLNQNSTALMKRLKSGKEGHAAAIIGIQYRKEGQTKYWIVKNSWGQDFADKGKFRIAMYSHSLPLEFIDVYFTINDLSIKDRRNYEVFKKWTVWQKFDYVTSRLQLSGAFNLILHGL